MMILGIVNGILLGVIAVFHFYWAAGGNFGKDAVFPDVKGKGAGKTPGIFMTVLAGLIFGSFGYFALETSNFLSANIFKGFYNIGLIVLAVIFCLRAIGELNYVGFFKKHRDGKFAFWDTRFFSPLSLLIGINFLMMYLLKN